LPKTGPLESYVNLSALKTSSGLRVLDLLQKLAPTEIKGPIKYLCYGFEVAPKTGKVHVQGYLHTHNAIRLSTIRSFLPGAHCEMCKGSPLENIEYCKKEGCFFEYGVRPMTPQEKKEKSKKSTEAKYAEQWELAKAGKFEQLPPGQVKTMEYIYYKFGFKPVPNDTLQKTVKKRR